MRNSKEVLVFLILFLLLFGQFESRSLEAFMEKKKKTPLQAFSQTFITKPQLMNPFFTNPSVSKRLSPGGPDPKHH
ncbi:hypothetical protein VIGAN_07103100 [Vigna angularis var. angularis]|uniref:Uncharacterized protein n=1 Tax=Vigna angularis var. angularis TaxID=157739 RepID=A0A0S3SHR7_PHAAN|nr:hypothetical protein VIGAN_07103100 [Vigna angularis var. angularis]